MQKVITDDLDTLLEIFPPHISQTLHQQPHIKELLEVILDLGRPPEARFPHEEIILNPQEVTEQDIEYVTTRISPFGDDNRAGIERTLHRISAIRNRKGRFVGLTCRVGRAVFGTIYIIEDLIQSGNSILLLGRPGVGKTTMLREVVRVLADEFKKRVIIVDTSNEIAGDGDIPHPAIGHARRMQVNTPTNQHAVMIEAVENHMPEVIVIDEIGTELEAQAARTIAERGVQLVATAHGNTLDNLMMNPTLADLVGGIQTVTIGDEEAKRRGTQKSILERMSPPTFGTVIEIQDWDRVTIHHEVAEAVDTILRGQSLTSETRWFNENNEIIIAKESPDITKSNHKQKSVKRKELPSLFLFGVNKQRLEQVAKEMQLQLHITRNLSEANLLITSKSYYRRRPQQIRDAEEINLPIYILRSNTVPQIRQLLHTIYPRETRGHIQFALEEAIEAARKVIKKQEPVELNPQNAYIRRLQHLVAEQSDLSSRSLGKDTERRVMIYREETE